MELLGSTRCCLVLLALTWNLSIFAGVFAVNCNYRQGGDEFKIQLSSHAELKCEGTDPVIEQEGSGDQDRVIHDVLASPDALQDAVQNDFDKMLVRLGDLTKVMKLVDKSVDQGLGLDIENEVSVDSGLSQIRDEVLDVIYAEMTSLRRKLNTTEAKLALREAQLSNANETLKKTQTTLSSTSARLLKAESLSVRMVNQKEKLERRLKNAEKKLDDTVDELLKLQDIYQETSTRLSESNTMIRFLRGRVDYFSTQLKHTDDRLRDTTLKYNKLTRNHQRALSIITRRESQLTDCLNSKTNQFCGFEHDTICGFTFDTENSQFNWTWQHGPTRSSWTGPDIDHTCMSERGHFMYIEASSRRPGDTARMVSPKYLSVRREQCVEFYYHMYGADCGELKIQLLVNGVDTTPVWRMVGDQGDVWTLTRFVVPRQLATRGYQVVFEASIDRGYRSDIAIDDIKIYDGACPTDRGKIIDMYKYRRDGLT